ncbi:hypothetical protein [Conexibacter woesei]|uniref:hypothetical protein n=1 Tax=Conexibacter woesei TaxID=191495 RepID=UPI000413D630|nr:hypothetical protein [Conexibacter woesei]
MSRRWTTTIAAVAALGALAGAAGPAAADFGAPTLVSVSPREQADAVGTSALSADSRWLAYSGSLDGVSGVFRRNLQTGATDVVAGGDAYARPAIADARMPSISADGRYVSFSTTAALDTDDDTNAVADVYVRDMDAPAPPVGLPCSPGPGCAFALASAHDGAPSGLVYAAPSGSGTAGSLAAPRSALSADGRRVAFVTQSGSDLAGADTPALQVAVRDLDTQRTTLVSAQRDPSIGAMTTVPVTGGAVTPTAVEVGGNGLAAPVAVAALSADGTTVAWLGANIGLQAPTLPDERTDDANGYDEPLWRRVADGPAAPIRRVVGAGDPEAPGCPPGGTFADPACVGPYPDLASNGDAGNGYVAGWVTRPAQFDALPSLSADGRTVALLGTPPVPPLTTKTDIADLFVVDMRDGLARRDAVRRLTQDLHSGDAFNGVYDVGIAPDGRRIAFSTARSTFPLAPPYLTGGVPAQKGQQELYLVDLGDNTLRRVSRTVDGGPSLPPGVTRADSDGAASPSFDATGRMLAFDSPARNLVAVDANGANDVFLLTDAAPPLGAPGQSVISARPPNPAIPRAWTMALRAVAQKDGTVRLDADVPGPGVLRATVQATVPVTRHVRVRAAHGRHRTVTRRVLVRRQVAVRSTVVRAAGLWRLSIRVTKTYMSLVKGRAGLDATAKVTFAAPGRATLKDTLAVRFRVAQTKVTKKSKATNKKSKTTKKTTARAKR